MFKKWNDFLARKAKEYGEEKFFFVFLKLPILLICIYSLLITAAFFWSFNKNMTVAKDFMEMEKSCNRLVGLQRDSQRYRAQFQRQQLQQQYQQNTRTAAPRSSI